MAGPINDESRMRGLAIKTQKKSHCNRMVVFHAVFPHSHLANGSDCASDQVSRPICGFGHRPITTHFQFFCVPTIRVEFAKTAPISLMDFPSP